MERNFFRRIELAFPVLDPKLKKRVINEGLKYYLADNQQSWDMNGEGQYQRHRAARAKPRSAQGELMLTLGNAG
jgi:polyphosphate kinase